MLEHKFQSIEADVKEDGAFEGYASLFGVRDKGNDIVAKGAFSDSLSRIKPKMLWQHDTSRPIGVWKAVSEDEKGLFVSGKLNLNVTDGRDAYEHLKGGTIDGLSIGYRTQKARKLGDARELVKVELWEVSLVTFPMLPEAQISSVKGDLTHDKRLAEQVLREAGFSATEAKAAAAKIGQIRSEREAGSHEPLRIDVRSIFDGLK